MKLPNFCAVFPFLSFLLKPSHCSYLNCNEFQRRKILLMIMVQQALNRWNISFDLSEYVCQLSAHQFLASHLKKITCSAYNFVKIAKKCENCINFCDVQRSFAVTKFDWLMSYPRGSKDGLLMSLLKIKWFVKGNHNYNNRCTILNAKKMNNWESQIISTVNISFQIIWRLPIKEWK